MTPLHVAAERGHSEIVKYLSDKEADINIKDDGGVSETTDWILIYAASFPGTWERASYMGHSTCLFSLVLRLWCRGRGKRVCYTQCQVPLCNLHTAPLHYNYSQFLFTCWIAVLQSYTLYETHRGWFLSQKQLSLWELLLCVYTNLIWLPPKFCHFFHWLLPYISFSSSDDSPAHGS